MAYKAMYKNEIARAAGVSRAVFRVWLKADKQALEAMGITSKCVLNTLTWFFHEAEKRRKYDFLQKFSLSEEH